MRNREFVGLVIASILFGFIVSGLYTSTIQKREIITYEEQHFKDSLEIEYYKKQLETYPFEHSKIPENGK